MMLNNKSYFVLVLSILAFSCQENSGSSDKKITRSLNSISNKQGEVLDKLSKIEKTQIALQKGIDELKKGQKAVPPTKKDNKKQQPPKADPNKVYEIAIGNSVVLGKKDAPVTIIEWTDFQ